jgi:hypothetical protein
VKLKGTIVCGRKFCSLCHKWRHIHDFQVRSRKPDHPEYGHLTAPCTPCKRVQMREYHRSRTTDAEYMERKREYQRIMKEAQRRRAGVEPRTWGSRANRRPDSEPVQRLPVGPFRSWLVVRRQRFDTLRDLSMALGVEESLLGHVLAGRKTHVLLDTVDRALTRDGSTFLWELYPCDDVELAA